MASTYTTKQGDTWDIVSLLAYGSQIHVDKLISANFAQRNVAVFGAGVVLSVPEIPAAEQESSNVPPWRR